VTHPAPTLDTLQGLWRRSLIVWPDRQEDRSTSVHWLQGPRLYADLRQPDGAPSFAHIASLDDLTRDELLWLAHQEAFAGPLQADGEHFEWRHAIDLQPPSPRVDRGRLWFESGHMIEQGLELDYIGHWHCDDIAPLPCSAARLAAVNDERTGFLLRAGSHFMYARDRAWELPPHAHLAECVRAASSLAAAQMLLDFEMSFGHITARGWVIERSTLPFRVGQKLAPRAEESERLLFTTDVDRHGAPFERAWNVVYVEGSLDDLAVASSWSPQELSPRHRFHSLDR
jgi:hypothetical protein